MKATVAAVAINGIGLYGNTRQLIKGERHIPVAVYGLLIGTPIVYAACVNADWHNWRSEATIVTAISATAVVLAIANLMQDPPKKESPETRASEGAMRLRPTLQIEEGVITGGGIQMLMSF